uniref:Fungal lipase-like domain-containing protein n=1 Tax=Acrobeloides nanus TaxID=290746 RepID=A0A914CHS6_9BILA
MLALVIKSFFLLLTIFASYIQGLCNYNDCKSCTKDNGLLGLILPCCWNPQASSCQASLLTGLCANGSTEVTYNCPESPPSDFAYTDGFGRNYTLPFIASAYGDFNQAKTCLKNQVPNATLVAVYNDLNNCSSVLALLPSQNAIVVAFRGTQGGLQFVITALNLILAGPVVFGHSLGAALASLTSTYAVYQNIFISSEVKTITTGQPRTGDLDYAKIHDTRVPHSYRLINVADLVTKLPLKANLDDTYAFHHHFEIWYYENMLPGANFTICDQAEDSSCSSSTSLAQSLSADYHNTYFNVSIDTWFGTGCV